MSQDPNNQGTCEICQQSFSTEQELQNHQNVAHGDDDRDKPSNYDIERDQPNQRRIA